MDTEYLQEYEYQEYQKHKKAGNLSKRINELKQPIFNLSSPCPSFWSQLPFSGTMIVPLTPKPENLFETFYNFSIDEIPDVIKFAKETKKIQFVLSGRLTDFSECDYLDPFFEELHPPLYLADMSFDNDRNNTIYEESCKELLPLFKESPPFFNFFVMPNGRHMINEFIIQYTNLRYFGFDEIADTFLKNIVNDPEFASFYIETAYELMIHPLIDPLKANLAISTNTIQRANKMGLNQKAGKNKWGYPEIGSFLMKKTTHYPESLNACKDLISRYEENDLYNVYSSFSNAVAERNSTAIVDDKNELDVIMQNVWEDTKSVKQRADLFKYGIAVTIGVVGFSVNPVLGGLLSAIGLPILTQTKSSFLDKHTELFSKKMATPYIANIYDFQKKYLLHT